MALKFYINMAKRLKLIVKNFCGLIPTFLEVTGEKLVGALLAQPPLPILERVNVGYFGLLIKIFM